MFCLRVLGGEWCRERCAPLRNGISVDLGHLHSWVTYAGKVSNESIIEVKGTVIVPEKPVETCSQKVELAVQTFHVINKSAPELPF